MTQAPPTTAATRWAAAWVGLAILASTSALTAEAPSRSREGLLALYTFESTDGPIKDRSGTGKPLDLKIDQPTAVRRTKGSLEIRGKTKILSNGPATKIISEVRANGQITIEAWIQPANTKQKGPARIVSISRDTTHRNLTLGQDSDRFDVRFRTNKTDKNGMPSLASKAKSLTTQPTHVVYTRDRSGKARLYLNGKRVSEKTVAGDAKAWDAGFRLSLGNEVSGDRPWLGTLRLVAVYGRPLNEAEIKRHFAAGAGASTVAAKPIDRSRELFETRVAGILANHCLECHDTTARKGKLDLSTRVGALAGGKDGKAIVHGKADQSPLWESVVDNDMPKKRKPLSAEEKAVLKEWLDTGAAWSISQIDPHLYGQDQRAAQNWVRRLTVEEYIRTVRDTVGVDVEAHARRMLPPDLRADGFTNTAYNLGVDLKHVEAYARLAGLIVGKMDVMGSRLRSGFFSKRLA